MSTTRRNPTTPEPELLKAALRVARTYFKDHGKSDAAAEKALRLANAAMRAYGAYGVEVLRGTRNTPGGFWSDAVLAYVNAGDPYYATVLYDTNRETFSIGGWGDWLEKNERRYGL
jgi:hypothetical protein